MNIGNIICYPSPKLFFFVFSFALFILISHYHFTLFILVLRYFPYYENSLSNRSKIIIFFTSITDIERKYCLNVSSSTTNKKTINTMKMKHTFFPSPILRLLSGFLQFRHQYNIYAYMQDQRQLNQSLEVNHTYNFAKKQNNFFLCNTQNLIFSYFK